MSNSLSVIYSLNDGAYIGSIRAGQEDVRLAQHRAGQCRTTKKMAAKHGADLSSVEMEILYVYDRMITPDLEDEVMNEHKTDGEATWNFSHCLSTEDMNRGRVRGARLGGLVSGRRKAEIPGRMAAMGRVQGRRNASNGHLVAIASIGGRIGGRANVTSGQIAALGRSGVGGRIGGLVGGRTTKERGVGFFAQEVRGVGLHVRWHVNRGIINPQCALCKSTKNTEAKL